MTPDPLDALELELRQMPGVRLVGFGEADDMFVVQLGVVGDVDLDDLRRRATRVADSHLDGPVVVEVAGQPANGPPVAGAARVRVLAVISLPDDEVEVHLARDDRRTIGRQRSADAATASVDATLEALRALGCDVPFELSWAGPVGEPDERAVAVSLRPSHGSGTRYGLASGSDLFQAGARATLDALNRHLTSGPARGASASPSD